MQKLFRRGTLAVVFFAALAASKLNAQETLTFTGSANFMGLPPIPIHLSGFSGEVLETLRYDLYVMGFKEAPLETAKYVLSGSNDTEVKAELRSGTGTSTKGTSTALLYQSYSGPRLRALAHRLADDVVFKITEKKGIAETRIGFKVETGTRGQSEIYIADFDGRNPEPVTRDKTIVAAPCWVPGHMAMYYTSYLLNTPHIFYQNLRTGDRSDFAHYAGMNSSAAVSPDGKKIAMILSKSGSPDVWVCDADGSNLRDLTPTKEDESSPCWSHDGKWIYYAGKVNERRVLARVSVNGGAPHTITTGVSNPSEPDLSPDGKWIAFTSQHGGSNPFDICIVPAEGGAAIVVASGEDPCWAPNSRNLVFVKRINEVHSLSLLDVPTRQVKDVARVSGRDSNNSQPSWAR